MYEFSRNSSSPISFLEQRLGTTTHTGRTYNLFSHRNAFIVFLIIKILRNDFFYQEIRDNPELNSAEQNFE